MKARLPTIFVSHGAPSILYEPIVTRDFLTNLSSKLERPKGIICISAHWTTSTPAVTAGPAPAMIYDFGGFSDELYRITYPATGDPVLAEQVIALLNQKGIKVLSDVMRGFDHGAWVPLKLMYPEADIPVIQLSVQPHLSPEHHLAIGQALRPLRDAGILILASGSATHNLRDFFDRDIDAKPPEYVSSFDDWLQQVIEANEIELLCDYLHKAPHAAQNHPTAEHFLPIFVALGGGDTGRVLHRSYSYGVISMAAYAWD